MATGNARMTVSPEEFLRRFPQHVLPKGFPRIRYFGWLANRKRQELLPLCRCLLHQHASAADAAITVPTAALWSCPNCGRPPCMSSSG